MGKFPIVTLLTILNSAIAVIASPRLRGLQVPHKPQSDNQQPNNYEWGLGTGDVITIIKLYFQSARFDWNVLLS